MCARVLVVDDDPVNAELLGYLLRAFGHEAILTLGGRTVCNLLRTLRALAPGHPSSYHRVFSKRRWSSWRLARLLAGWIFDAMTETKQVTWELS